MLFLRYGRAGMQERAQAMFEMDQDRDGQLSLEEYLELVVRQRENVRTALRQVSNPIGGPPLSPRSRGRSAGGRSPEGSNPNSYGEQDRPTRVGSSSPRRPQSQQSSSRRQQSYGRGHPSAVPIASPLRGGAGGGSDHRRPSTSPRKSRTYHSGR